MLKKLKQMLVSATNEEGLDDAGPPVGDLMPFTGIEEEVDVDRDDVEYVLTVMNVQGQSDLVVRWYGMSGIDTLKQLIDQVARKSFQVGLERGKKQGAEVATKPLKDALKGFLGM